LNLGQVLDVGLAALVLALALYALAARSTYSAALGFVAYGLLLALVWVRLAAVDVALTEAAIGSGLTGALLLGAAARLRGTELAAKGERPGIAARLGAAVLAATVTATLAVAVLALPQPAPSLAAPTAENLAATGLGNPVTGVLMAFRGTDTFLEKVVLVLALLGVWSLAADRYWGGRLGLRHQADPLGALVFFARLLLPLGIVVGLYLFWVGADHPGGAFQGGTVLAAMWLLAMMTRLSDAPPIARRGLRLLLICGPGLFLLVGLGGLWFGEAFLAYPLAFAKPLILGIEIAMTATVAATLGLLLVGPPQRTDGADGPADGR
jgi:multisubunit Na+/H+ antiporter MnhB subunit